MKITKKIISIDDQDIRSNTTSSFEADVERAVQAGVNVGIVWQRDPYYGGRVVAVDIDSPGECPELTAVARRKGQSYELVYE